MAYIQTFILYCQEHGILPLEQMGLLGQNMTLDEKTEISIEIVKSAGALALKFFQDLANLNVEKNGRQDFVSRADKDVELFVRAALE
jgi:hypothetical protein